MSQLTDTRLNLIAIREGLYAKRSRMVRDKATDDQLRALNHYLDDIISEIKNVQDRIDETNEADARSNFGLDVK